MFLYSLSPVPIFPHDLGTLKNMEKSFCMEFQRCIKKVGSRIFLFKVAIDTQEKRMKYVQS